MKDKNNKLKELLNSLSEKTSTTSENLDITVGGDSYTTDRALKKVSGVGGMLPFSLFKSPQSKANKIIQETDLEILKISEETRIKIAEKQQELAVKYWDEKHTNDFKEQKAHANKTHMLKMNALMDQAITEMQRGLEKIEEEESIITVRELKMQAHEHQWLKYIQENIS